MAAYPSFPQLIGSTREAIDDLVLDRSVAGGAKSRAFYATKKNRFKIRHLLSATDAATLEAFYDTNRLLTVTLAWGGNGSSYTVLFEGPLRPESLGGGLTRYDVMLSEQ